MLARICLFMCIGVVSRRPWVVQMETECHRRRLERASLVVCVAIATLPALETAVILRSLLTERILSHTQNKHVFCGTSSKRS